MSIKIRLQQHLASLGIRLLALLPFTALQRLGQMLGFLLAKTPNKLRRVTTLNIEHCFPELSKPEQQILIQQSLQHTVITTLEMPYLWSRKSSEVLALIKKNDPMPLYKDHPNGLIFLLPHLGAWEIFTVFACQFAPVIALYRPPKKAFFEKIILKARERDGMILVPTTTSGVKALYQGLKSGKSLGILPDQDPVDSGGVFAPFFGIPAWTMTFVARLAQKSQASVFFAYAERKAIGQGFHIHFIPASPGIYADTPLASATSMNQDIEKIARTCLAQYQWGYKRFRRQPDGAQNFYDSSA